MVSLLKEVWNPTPSDIHDKVNELFGPGAYASLVIVACALVLQITTCERGPRPWTMVGNLTLILLYAVISAVYLSLQVWHFEGPRKMVWPAPGELAQDIVTIEAAAHTCAISMGINIALMYCLRKSTVHLVIIGTINMGVVTILCISFSHGIDAPFLIRRYIIMGLVLGIDFAAKPVCYIIIGFYVRDTGPALHCMCLLVVQEMRMRRVVPAMKYILTGIRRTVIALLVMCLVTADIWTASSLVPRSNHRLTNWKQALPVIVASFDTAFVLRNSHPGRCVECFLDLEKKYSEKWNGNEKRKSLMQQA